MIKKIITHAGVFHADEVLAVAILRYYGINCQVERKFNVSPEELNDPSILVLDVAKVHDPMLGNFDHHQSADMPATDVLVAHWLVENGLMPSEVFDGMLDFLNYISDVDRGIIPAGGPAASFNGIIRSMNPVNVSDPAESNNAFELAVQMAEKILYYQIKTAERAVEDEKVWKQLERFMGGKVVIQEDNYQLANWTKLAERDDVLFMVTPNLRTPGAWQIISRDSKLYNIPVDARQTFRHPSGFMAVYASKEDAIGHVEEMVK